MYFVPEGQHDRSQAPSASGVGNFPESLGVGRLGLRPNGP
jgi:hypothetical protein